jgi:AcrR family transcriptional regulator
VKGGGSDAEATGGEEEGDELRARLLAAAAAVFARSGYAGTKVMDIVREAGLSAGALYGRFESKNDLLREAVVRRSTQGGFMLGGAASLRGLFRGTARLTNQPLTDGEAMRLEAYVSARREPAVADALADAHAGWRANIQPLVDAAIADGALSDDFDPEAVLFLFRTLYLGLLLQRASGMHAPDDTAWVQLVDHVARSLARPMEEASRQITAGPHGQGDALHDSHVPAERRGADDPAERRGADDPAERADDQQEERT